MEKPSSKEMGERLKKLLSDPPQLKQSEQLNISIIIDTYDDIFSDFDPRPYNERALSEDFVAEVRRRHVPHKKGGIEVRFLVPDLIRDQKTETVIKKRMKSYFREEEKELEQRANRRKKTGYIYITSGAVLLSAIAYIGLNYPENLVTYVLEVLLVPAGWFGMWEGIGKAIEREENLATQAYLYHKLAESAYTFIPESEALNGPVFSEISPKDSQKDSVSEDKADSPAKKTPKEALKEAPKEAAKEPTAGKPPDSSTKKTLKETIKEEIK